MQNFIPLESVQIATPCRADWNKMQGDDTVRFCQSCHKNVYNLSQMSREEAETLITEKEGRLCVRFFQRADGTILSGDCPVGKSVQRRPFWGLAVGFAALLASGVAALSGANASNYSPQALTPSNHGDTIERLRDVPVLGAIVNRISPPQFVTMGDIAFVPPKNAPIMGKMPTANTSTDAKIKVN